MARLIQIGNLPDSVGGDALRRLFETYGVVRGATVNRHYDTGRSTGVGFIEMESEKRGAAAVAGLNHRTHLGCVLSVCWSEMANTPARVARSTTLSKPISCSAIAATAF
jgi:RNA recognition motif-containing protein